MSWQIGLLLLILFRLSISNAQDEDIRYLQFHYDSEVVARYGRTRITSAVENVGSEAKQLSFTLALPDTAFVSNFSMQIGARRFYSVTEEKQAALDEFNNRSANGENVGLVRQIGDNFMVQMNVAAGRTATFALEYEELIIREQSKYRMFLNISPGKIVDDLRAMIRIKEPEGFSDYTTSSFATVQRTSHSEIVCSYNATVEQQRMLNPLSLTMTCDYDILHSDTGAGSFAIDGGYFAQFFSPLVSETLRINLVLVIDVSGSMSGTKIEQARDALVALLDQLHDDDYVAIVQFSSQVQAWRQEMVSVRDYRAQAKHYARSLDANGGTNLNDGLLNGIQFLQTSPQSHSKLVVLLTDGQPTAGITERAAIVENAIQATSGTGISVNCIGFGSYADMTLLEYIALSNSGLAKKIPEGANARDELAGFLREIANPVLADVEVTFSLGAVEQLTTTSFPFLFAGKELVVAGKFSSPTSESPISVNITGRGSASVVTYQSYVSAVDNTIIAGSIPSSERLRAFLKIKNLIDQKKVLEIRDAPSADIMAVDEAVLELALRYNFVTELTSLLVIEEGNNSSNITTMATTPNDNELDPSIFLTGYPTGVRPQSAGGANSVHVYTISLLLSIIVYFIY